MSGLSAKCCQNFQPFPSPKFPCVTGDTVIPDVCSTLIKASITAIIRARSPLGLTASEINTGIQALCGVPPVPAQELQRVLDTGAKRGILKRCSKNGEFSFLVNALMTLSDPQNIDFSPCLCDLYQEAPRKRPPVNIKPLTTPCTVTLDGIQDVQPVPQPCSTCPDGCFSNPY